MDQSSTPLFPEKGYAWSESEVEGHDELRERGQERLVLRCGARGRWYPRVANLRVRSDEVRPGREIAPRHRQSSSPDSGSTHPLLRQPVRRRDLPQLHERSVLNELILHARGRRRWCDAREVLRRKPFGVVARFAHAERAGVGDVRVQYLVTPLEIDHAVEREALADRERVRDVAEDLGRLRPDENRKRLRTGDRRTAGRPGHAQDVADRVGRGIARRSGNALRPPAEDRIALDVTEIAGAARDAPHVFDPVLVGADVPTDLPREALEGDRPELRLKLDPTVARLANVDRLIPGESTRWRELPREDRVLRAPRVVGEVQAQTIEEPCLEARLPLGAALRLEIGIAERAWSHARRPVAAGSIGHRAQRNERVRLLPGLSVCAPELQGIDDVAEAAPERLLADHPRGANLRIGDPVQVFTERRVVVHTHAGGKEEAIVPPELLLPVNAHGRVDDELLRRCTGHGRPRDGFHARRGEPLTRKRAVLELLPHPLSAN